MMKMHNPHAIYIEGGGGTILREAICSDWGDLLTGGTY